MKLHNFFSGMTCSAKGNEDIHETGTKMMMLLSA